MAIGTIVHKICTIIRFEKVLAGFKVCETCTKTDGRYNAVLCKLHNKNGRLYITLKAKGGMPIDEKSPFCYSMGVGRHPGGNENEKEGRGQKNEPGAERPPPERV